MYKINQLDKTGAENISANDLLALLKKVKSEKDLPREEIMDALAHNIWLHEVPFGKVLSFIDSKDFLSEAFAKPFLKERENDEEIPSLYEVGYLREMYPNIGSFGWLFM